ncbi:MAG TPA: serine/threonine-protein kinase [Polyangia bacterium]|nr:serine/threonine-protein kinase [Polyangia bacterium]
MLARGVTIGRYVVLTLVGRGGMGEVYAAYDPELDRKVAIKLLRARGVKADAGAQATQDSGRARLMREAQAIAKLSHPNVVVVYDVGTFEDQVFIAMEFVDGHTLGYWMNAQARARADVLKVFAAAGRGLAAAHDKNLVHRDFKPDNVMIGSDGQVRVMDFGLARLAGDRAQAPTPLPDGPAVPTTIGEGEFSSATTMVVGVRPTSAAKAAAESTNSRETFDQRLTQTGAMLGTPAYMAPEQFLGKATDARTDQFSFCVALYEALYGERPFAGNTLFGLTASVVQGNVNPAPAKSQVSPWLRKALLRGLSVKPDQRWPSMNALLAELERNRAVAGRRRFADGAAAKLAGIWEAPGRGQRVETTAKTSIKEAFLATNKRYAATSFENASKVLDRYAAAWTDMYVSACEATHTRGEQSAEMLDLRMAALQEALHGLRALCDAFRGATAEVVENAVDAANSLPSIERCADFALLRAAVKPPEDPAMRATVDRLRERVAEVRTLSRVGRFTDALKAIGPLEQEVRNTGYQPLLAEALLEQGFLHIERRHLEEASLAYEEALWTAELVRQDEMTAEAATALVSVSAGRERFELGDVWARYAETVLTRMGGHERLWGWLLNNLGQMRQAQGLLVQALDTSQRAVVAKEKALGADNPDLGITIGNMAFYYTELGNLEEALKHGERAIKILEQGLGPEHPRTALCLSNLCETLNQLGRFAEARQVAQRALVIFERETEADGIFVTAALTALGLAYLDDGLAAEALPILERAVANRENRESGAPARLGEVHFALARALWQVTQVTEDRARARALAERARDEFAQATASPAVERAQAAIGQWLARSGP